MIHSGTRWSPRGRRRGWVLTKRAAAKGAGSNLRAAAAGGLLQVAGAGVDSLPSEPHTQVRADAAARKQPQRVTVTPSSGKATGPRSSRGPSLASEIVRVPGNSKLPTWPSPLPGAWDGQV